MNFIFTLHDINDAARKVWQAGWDKNIWAFHGEMGAGKTTIIHALCDILGVTSTVGSPTYSLINEYVTGDEKIIYHIDLYRLNDEDEALNAGVEDCLYSNNLCFLEWPERVPQLMPPNCFHVFVDVLDEKTRAISTR